MHEDYTDILTWNLNDLVEKYPLLQQIIDEAELCLGRNYPEATFTALCANIVDNEQIRARQMLKKGLLSEAEREAWGAIEEVNRRCGIANQEKHC